MVDKKFADAFKKKLQQETGASQEWMDKHLIVDFGSLTDDDSNDQDETEAKTSKQKPYMPSHVYGHGVVFFIGEKNGKC